MLKVVARGAGREAGEQLFELDEIARIGARRMLMAALKTGADDYVERHREERDETGRALVVHNGRSQGRKLTLGTGTVELRAPRVNDRRRDEQGQRQRFSSRILPPYMRRSPKVAEVLPILYLRGLSTGDFRPALEGLLGEDAAGLSPTNITRLTACWEKEYTAFRRRDLTGREYVYVWVDGVHFNIRLADACWCHKLANVLDKLPQRLQPRAKRALHEMMYAACRTDCAAARSRFEAEYQAKYPRAVESLTANWERLVTFFDFPAEHWKHLRTTKVIESPFATVRLRERATKGAGSRTKGLLMAFKLLDMAQLRWRRLDGAQLLPLVRAGVKFADGVRVDPAKLVTQSTDNQPRKAA